MWYLPGLIFTRIGRRMECSKPRKTCWSGGRFVWEERNKCCLIANRCEYWLTSTGEQFVVNSKLYDIMLIVAQLETPTHVRMTFIFFQTGQLDAAMNEDTHTHTASQCDPNMPTPWPHTLDFHANLVGRCQGCQPPRHEPKGSAMNERPQRQRGNVPEILRSDNDLPRILSLYRVNLLSVKKRRKLLRPPSI